MSQYPPPGGPPNYPPQPPQGFGMPGGPGQPGFGGQGYSLPAVNKTSGAAVASLVCGLVFCIPGITGLVAVITGIIGIASTGKPGVRGRGMAIAGLILGLLSLAGWGIVGAGMMVALHGAKPIRDFAKTYVTDLSAGSVDKCVGNSSSNITKEYLDAESKKMQAWGTLQDTTIFGFNLNTNNGAFTGQVTGICKYSSGPHSFQMMLVKDSSGQLKADTFIWQN